MKRINYYDEHGKCNIAWVCEKDYPLKSKTAKCIYVSILVAGSLILAIMLIGLL